VIESAPLVLGGTAPHARTGYGKFGGAAGIESFTEQRWVTIRHSGRPTYPF
jgi:acyl-CoA reductase-like NAD-dependent aldehyde dehydrogenase